MPKRPPTAYMLFTKWERQKLSQWKPLEKIKIVATKWKSLTDEEKSIYQSQARDAQDKYRAELLEYEKKMDEG